MEKYFANPGDTEPPPLPTAQRRLPLWIWLIIGIASLMTLAFAVLVGLRVTGRYQPFRVPTSAMAPAIAPGDLVLMENLSAQARHPRRGTIVVFRTDGLSGPNPDEYWVKRVVGEPGDRIRLIPPHLYVNDQPVSIRNSQGEIRYVSLPRTKFLTSPTETVVVPAGCHFVMGDNSAISLDGRFWGFLPAANICGRAWYCYGPSSRFGIIR